MSAKLEEKQNKPKVTWFATAAFLFTIAGIILLVWDMPATDPKMLLRLVTVVFTFPLLPITLGTIALVRIGKKPKQYRGRWQAVIGIASPGIYIFSLSIAAMFHPHNDHLLNSTAKSVGRNTRLAMEVFQNENQYYASNLDQLLTIDKDLTYDPSVTFAFVYANQSEYAFYTIHGRARKPKQYRHYSLNNTPILNAIRAGQIDEVKKLFEKKDSADEKIKDWRPSPLLYAIRHEKWEITRLLIEKGKDINRPFFGWHDRTPLHEAAELGNREIVALLLLHGAKIDERNEYGRTPLHLAANCGNTAVVGYLLSAGADVDIEDYTHRTPLSYAEENFQDKTIALLKKQK